MIISSSSEFILVTTTNPRKHEWKDVECEAREGERERKKNKKA